MMNKELLPIQERIEKLRAEIEEARYAYHVLDKNLMDEGVLDSLKNELFQFKLIRSLLPQIRPLSG